MDKEECKNCQKKSYANKKLAENAAYLYNLRNGCLTGGMGAFLCSTCGVWKIGHGKTGKKLMRKRQEIHDRIQEINDEIRELEMERAELRNHVA